MIDEISDPQDVHMNWKKAKPLGALNMIRGQIFSGLIPIRPLKIPLVQPLCYSRRLVTASLGVEFAKNQSWSIHFASSFVKASQNGEKNPTSPKQDQTPQVSLALAHLNGLFLLVFLRKIFFGLWVIWVFPPGISLRKNFLSPFLGRLGSSIRFPLKSLLISFGYSQEKKRKEKKNLLLPLGGLGFLPDAGDARRFLFSIIYVCK